MKRIIPIIMTLSILLLNMTAFAASPNHGDLVITLTDQSTGAPLDGATFQVYTFSGALVTTTQISNGQYSNGGIVTTLNTNGGTAKIENLPIGTYTIKQITAPAGKQTDANAQKTSTIADQQTANVYFLATAHSPTPTPTPTPLNPNPTPNPTDTANIHVTVLDAKTNKGIKSAEIAIYDMNNSTIERLTTDSYGEAFSSMLPAGVYSLRQTSAPTGYIANESRQNVTLSSAQVSIEIKNTQAAGTGKIVTNDHQGKGITGATYSVYKDGGEKHGDFSSDGNGEIYLNNTPTGKYYFTQTKAPSGFQLATGRFDLEIKESGMTEITVVNQPMTGTTTLYITAEDKKPAPSVSLSIYNTRGEIVSTITSNLDGYSTVNLPYGDYYATVTATVKGYKLENNRFSFSLNEKSNAQINVPVISVKGSIKVTVTDLAGLPSPSLAFILFAKDGAQVLEQTTDQNGVTTFENVKGGEYYIEQKALTNAKRHTVNVTDEKQVQLAIKSNQSKQGTLIIYFRHIDDNREISAKRSYTDNVGTDYMQWVTSNKLDKPKVSTFTFIRAEYPAESRLIEGTLTITYWYSGTGRTDLSIKQEFVDEGTAEQVIEDEEAIQNTAPEKGFNIPEEKSDVDYNEPERVSAPKTGDKGANIALALSSATVVLAAGIIFIKKRLKQV